MGNRQTEYRILASGSVVSDRSETLKLVVITVFFLLPGV